MRYRPFTRTWSLLLPIVFFCGVVGTPATADEQKPYHLLVSIPLSGPVATLGNYVRHGLALAEKDLTDEQRRTIQIDYEDDQFSPAKTISAYRSKASLGEVDAVFVLGSPPANALVPITEADKKILVAIGASDASIVEKRQYAFIHWVTPSTLAQRLVAELEKRGSKRLALVTSEASGPVADHDAAVEEIATHKTFTIVSDQRFVPEQTDFRTDIAKLRTQNVDTVIAALFPSSLSSFAKQFRGAAVHAQFAAIETLDDEATIKNAAGALLHAWGVSAANVSPQFADKYRAAFHEYPGWASANAYDALILLVRGIAEVGKGNDSLATYLDSVQDFDGACGRYDATGDHRFTLPAGVIEVTEKGIVKK